MKRLFSFILFLAVAFPVAAGSPDLFTSDRPLNGETVIKKLPDHKHANSLYSYAWIIHDGTGKKLLKLMHSNGTRSDHKIQFGILCKSTGRIGKYHQYLSHSYHGAVERVQYFTLDCPENNVGLKFANYETWNSIDSNIADFSVDDMLDKMEFGAIAFNVPENINVEDSKEILLMLSLAESVEKLKQSIATEGAKFGTTIKVSDRMEARLSGHMFQVTAITPEVQAVSKNKKTEWKWEIHPIKDGKHKLHLTLTALLEIDGYSTPRTIRTFDKTIEVEILATQIIKRFFNNNWQWLWAAILVPIAGWRWKQSQLNVENTHNKAN